MDNNLANFASSYTHLQGVRAAFTPIKERWYSWNYWAQHHSLFSFDDWMDDCGLKFRQIKAKGPYPEADVVYDKEYGYRYYSEWRGAQVALDDAEEEFDENFQVLWSSKNSNGEYVYSNEKIGEVIGKTGEQLRKFAAKKSWYKPRSKRKGTNK